MKILKQVLILLSIIITLTLILKGRPGVVNGQTMNSDYWRDNGPFELSPERGRFALTYSIVETNSVFFSLPVARFATPDLGMKNGKYVSLFAPGISYLVVPGYLIGKILGSIQVGSFAIISLFAFINFLLIRSISIRMGAGKYAAHLAGLVFLFSTPAAAYAGILYQHHVSTFLILAAIYILLRWNNLVSLVAIWFLCAASIPIDYPNLVLMLPIGIFAIARIVNIEKVKNKIILFFKPLGLLTFVGVAIPLSFFLWFNNMSYGNPLQFSGTIPSVTAIDASGNPTTPDSAGAKRAPESYLNPEVQKKSAVGFFKTRNLVNGLYIHLISPDRGIIFFSPVILLGLIGIWIAYQKNNPYLQLLVGVIAANLILYSLWGDPWGGWAFGSRYLIPAYSILAIFLSLVLTHWKKYIVFNIIFYILFVFSTSVNILGALTSNRNPPQVEILGLEKITNRRELYSFDRNWEYLNNSGSKSFIFNSLANKALRPVDYYLLVVFVPLMSGTFLLFLNRKYVED